MNEKKLEKYKLDLENLINKGTLLRISLLDITDKLDKETGKIINNPEVKKNIPNFFENYESWYSESLELLKQLAPSRLEDFIGYYKPMGKISRKEIGYANYTISDCLIGLVIKNNFTGEVIVGPSSATTKYKQQLNILKSLKRKFESSLFDIEQLLQADIFDSELEAAKELNKKGFPRGAGAVAGVVLESHLLNILETHKIKVSKKNPSINDLSQLLKDNDVIDLPKWRSIQHLADLRNLCDHKKDREPKKEDIEELIISTDKIIKTVY